MYECVSMCFLCMCVWACVGMEFSPLTQVYVMTEDGGDDDDASMRPMDTMFTRLP